MPRPPTIDLHVHSVYSDGRLTPEEIAARARGNGVVAVAMTDHDTLAGWEGKRAACDRAGVECVCGVELSCETSGRETHILSLFADPDSEGGARLEELRRERKNRMLAMLDNFSRLGVSLTLEDLPNGHGGSYGRPHLARALVKKGVVKTVNEAFGRYLYDKGPVNVPKRRLPADEGIALAKSLGGVAILAHPGISGVIDKLDVLRSFGLDGVEAYHPKHGGETVAMLLEYCARHEMLVSGGSDFHAVGEGPDIGSMRVPPELLDRLRETAARRKG